MIGYKVAISIDKKFGPFLVTVRLDIPETSKVVVPENGNKLRCDYAKVTNMVPFPFCQRLSHLRLESPDVVPTEAYSIYELASFYKSNGATYIKTKYVVGSAISSILDFSTNVECAPGIHFFRSILYMANWVELDDPFVLSVLRCMRDAWNTQKCLSQIYLNT